MRKTALLAAAIAFLASPALLSKTGADAQANASQGQPNPPAALLLGFADGVPLRQALQTIIPPSTRWRIGPGIDQDERVSWQGGKVWRDVLADMLRSSHLAQTEDPAGAILITPPPKQAPLTEALRAILPATVHATIEPDIDPNATITWTPGESWNIVLGAALAQAGLHAKSISGGELRITRATVSGPLRQALEKIIPAGHRWQLAPGVDANTALNWTPTPDWRKTLAAALASGGLSSIDNNGAIVVSLAGETAPLAKALPHIVPPSVIWEIAPGVPADATVSWTPGGDWRHVLAAALEPKALAFVETGKDRLQIVRRTQTATLSSALAAIVPAGVRWRVAAGVDSNASLSWKPGPDWKTTLDAALMKASLRETRQPDGAIEIAMAPRKGALRDALAALLPAGTRVQYAAGIDPSAQATWTPIAENEDWRPALAAALDPIGLTTAISDKQVEILHKPKTAPLSAAIASIVPPNYEWSLDQGVDPRTPLTWSESTNPQWRKTLDSALAQAGLMVNAAGPRTLRIGKYAAGIPISNSKPTYGSPRLWKARRGETVHAVLLRWAAESRPEWTISWPSSIDYPVKADARFEGNLKEALRQLFLGMATAHPTPTATLWTANRVIVVSIEDEDN